MEYVRHRMTAAGVERQVFSIDALALLHEGTGGRLRDVDRVATGCLREAARSGHQMVDRDIAGRILTADQVR